MCCPLQTRESGQRPAFEMIHDIRDLDTLRTKPRTHAITCDVVNPETEGPVQVPLAMTYGRTCELRFLAAAGGPTAQVIVPFVGPADSGAGLHAALNDQPLGPPAECRQVAGAKEPAFDAVFPAAEAVCIVDGFNSVRLRHEGGAVTVVGLDVHVEP